MSPKEKGSDLEEKAEASRSPRACFTLIELIIIIVIARPLRILPLAELTAGSVAHL